MPARLVLHAPAALIELVVRELHDMERIGDLDRVGHHRVEHQPIRARQIQRRVCDVREPLAPACFEPPARLHRAATRDNIQQLPGADIDDRRREGLTVPRTDPHEQRLIQPERGRRADPVRVVIDERGPVRDHRVVDRVPRTLELTRELVHGATMLADLAGHPPPRPIRHRGTRAARSVTSSPVHDPTRTRGVRALPTMLAPHQPGRPPERGEIDQLDLGPVLDQHHARATPYTPVAAHASRSRPETATPARRSRRAHSHRADLPTAHRYA